MNKSVLLVVMFLLVIGVITISPQTQPNKLVNIAPDAKVFTSGQYSSYYPSTAAHDGKELIVRGLPTSDSPQWIYLDLGEVKQIDGYRLKLNDPYYAAHYRLFDFIAYKDYIYFGVTFRQNN